MLSTHDMSGSFSVPYIRKYENLMKTGQETVEANNEGIISSYSTPLCARVASSVSYMEEPLELCGPIFGLLSHCLAHHGVSHCGMRSASPRLSAYDIYPAPR
jgi:hypothetical protein